LTRTGERFVLPNKRPPRPALYLAGEAD
jgi:hypothetical protein